MQYFITNAERVAEERGTCFFEFVAGAYTGAHWQPDALLLAAFEFDRLRLWRDLFAKTMPEFAYYGITEFDAAAWRKLSTAARECGGEIAALFAELTPWAEDTLAGSGKFTVLGI